MIDGVISKREEERNRRIRVVQKIIKETKRYMTIFFPLNINDLILFAYLKKGDARCVLLFHNRLISLPCTRDFRIRSRSRRAGHRRRRGGRRRGPAISALLRSRLFLSFC